MFFIEKIQYAGKTFFSTEDVQYMVKQKDYFAYHTYVLLNY